METNISNLKIEISTLNNLLEEYNTLALNLYKELSYTSSYWSDGISTNFFSNVNIEKLKIKKSIDELQNIIDIYTYIIEQYQMLGNQIKINLESKEKILTNIDNYINKINEIINSYTNLDLSFCGGEAKSIISQKNNLIKIKTKTEKLKEKIKKLFNKIEEVEKEIKVRIARIKVEIVEESDISPFI